MKLEKHVCVEEAKLMVFFCLFFCVIHKHVACLPWGFMGSRVNLFLLFDYPFHVNIGESNIECG